jgi:phage FluMu protein gp41
MAPLIVPLKDGLKVGGTVHLEAELRLPTAADILDAGLQAERAVPTPDGYMLLISPSQHAAITLGRQIVRIGDHAGPLMLEELRKFSARDLQALQLAAAELDGSKVQASLENRGRSEAPGEGAGGR